MGPVCPGYSHVRGGSALICPQGLSNSVPLLRVSSQDRESGTHFPSPHHCHHCTADRAVLSHSSHTQLIVVICISWSSVSPSRFQGVSWQRMRLVRPVSLEGLHDELGAASSGRSSAQGVVVIVISVTYRHRGTSSST